MTPTKALYIKKVATELQIQSTLSVDRPSAMIKMLVKTAADTHSLYPNCTDRLLNCLEVYYRCRVHSYIPLQREVAALFITTDYFRTASRQLFIDENATKLNIHVVIRSWLLMLSNSLLSMISESAERENYAS